MVISVFTDEIDRGDPQRAIQRAAAWGVSHVEVRTLTGGRFPAVADDELTGFRKMVADAGLQVSGVSPGYFKCPVDDPAVDAAMSEGLPRACEWAQRLGTDLVSCFGFRRGPGSGVPPEAVDGVSRVADVVKASGCRLVLENEAVCWGATGVEAAEMIRQIGPDRVSLCWDPGNSARAGSTCPFPDEYETFRDLVTHLHVKNFEPEAGEWSVVEKGIVDWRAQFEALSADRYAGFVVIETHLAISPDEFEVTDEGYTGLEANTRRNLEYVRKCLGI